MTLRPRGRSAASSPAAPGRVTPGSGAQRGWRHRWSVFLLWSLACSNGLAPTPAGSDIRSEHLWVFHINGGSYAAHIQLVAIGAPAGRPAGRVFRPLASRAADGTVTNDLAAFVATADDATGLRWTLRRPDGQALQLAYAIAGDTAFGALALPGGIRYPLVGVRFDSAAASLIAPSLVPVRDSHQPVVMLRLDDARGTDRDFLQRIKARGLTAELAVPTRLVGRGDNLTWKELEQWRAQGVGIVMHSRFHLKSSAHEQHLIAEIVGGFAEMKAHGFATNVFVQPGTWGDSIYFDSPQKLATWRGALLRTFATVSECYAYSPLLTRSAISPLGVGHVTISDGASDARIREYWDVAQRPNHATVILVHTFRLRTKNQLDWFLDLVAAARARGTVRVVANSQDLFGAAPPPLESRDSLEGSGTQIRPETP